MAQAEAAQHLADVPRNYSPEQRQRLAEAVRRGEFVRCPVCAAAMAWRPVAPPRALAYVRRRVWLICPECKRSAAVDLSAGGRS
ncbi:MAG: hypothetical protein HY561_05820 [Gemmatimonadetes bacterium]|nr:hypothetical protein [Gemmatimonadota bacterium]